MTVNTGLMTADDLWELPDDGMRHELVRGELRTMAPPGFSHGRSATRIGSSLLNYVEEHQLGEVVTSEIGFRLTTNPDTVRAPDVFFLSNQRLQERGEPQGFFPGAPDLVIEVVSPSDRYTSDRYTEVIEKVAELLQYGARLVFVVDPRRKTASVHRPGPPVRTLGIDDVLSGEDVVPGWTMRLRELFR